MKNKMVKSLAVTMAAAMAVTCLPATSVFAANGITGNATAYTKAAATYKVTGIGKGQRAKVSATNSTVKPAVVKKNGGAFKVTPKVKAAGTTITVKAVIQKKNKKKKWVTAKTYTKKVKVYNKATSVAMNKKTAAIYAKGSVTLKATVKPTKTKPVTWKSSNAKVAKVVKGKVTGVKAGTATITATVDGKKAACKVTVYNKVTGVTITGVDHINVGSTTTLKATVKPASGVKAADKKVTWSSSDKSIATVNAKGVVTGIKPGTVKITAKAGGKTATTTIAVNEKAVAVTGVKIDNEKPKAGQEINAVVDPENATNATYAWSVNGVDAGVTTSKFTVPANAKAGDVIKVVVTDGTDQKTYEATATVVEDIELAGITIAPNTPQTTDVMTATIAPAGAAADYQWLADGQAIAGATGQTFTVTADQIGKHISCQATGKDGYKGVVTSGNSDVVTAKTIKAAYKTDYTKNDVTVGQTLEIELDPAQAVTDVAVQWYRGTTKIDGATGLTYTLAEADANSKIHATVTPFAGKGYNTDVITLAETKTVFGNVNDWGLTLVANDSKATSQAGQAYTVKASLPDKVKTDDVKDWKVTAYLDSVDKNVRANGKWTVTKVNGNALTTGGTNRDSAVANVQNAKTDANEAARTFNFPERSVLASYTPTPDDAGHDVILVFEKTGWNGKVQFNAGATTIKLDDTDKVNVITSSTYDGTTAANAYESANASTGSYTNAAVFYPGVTVLTANVIPANTGTTNKNPKDATVEYQWLDYTNNNGTIEAVPIAGATEKTFTIPATLAGKTGTHQYGVKITGTGVFKGEIEDSIVGAILDQTKTKVQVKSITASLDDANKDGVANVGEKLTAHCNVEAADEYMDFFWFQDSDNDGNAENTDKFLTKAQTLTPAEAGNYFVVAQPKAIGDNPYELVAANATFDASGVASQNATAKSITAGVVSTFDVNGVTTNMKSVVAALTGVEITYTNGVEATDTANYKKYDTAELGEYIVATVAPNGATATYEWFLDTTESRNQLWTTTKTSGSRTKGTDNVGAAVAAKSTNSFKLGGTPVYTTEGDVAVNLAGHTLICVATGSGSWNGSKVNTASLEIGKEAKAVKEIKVTNAATTDWYWHDSLQKYTDNTNPKAHTGAPNDSDQVASLTDGVVLTGAKDKSASAGMILDADIFREDPTDATKLMAIDDEWNEGKVDVTYEWSVGGTVVTTGVWTDLAEARKELNGTTTDKTKADPAGSYFVVPESAYNKPIKVVATGKGNTILGTAEWNNGSAKVARNNEYVAVKVNSSEEKKLYGTGGTTNVLNDTFTLLKDQTVTVRVPDGYAVKATSTQATLIDGVKSEDGTTYTSWTFKTPVDASGAAIDFEIQFKRAEDNKVAKLNYDADGGSTTSYGSLTYTMFN